MSTHDRLKSFKSNSNDITSNKMHQFKQNAKDITQKKTNVVTKKQDKPAPTLKPKGPKL